MQNNLSPFSRNVWLTIVLLVILAFNFAAYTWSEKQIDRANNLRYNSMLLADELRQSSDDLTKMARAYVVTGDPIYKKHYLDILDIRNGNKPRPQAYQNIYWDFVVGNGQPPRPDSGQVIALLDLMQQAGFTEKEFRKLAAAKAHSDGLTSTEFQAMKLVEAIGPGTNTAEAGAQRAKAINMLFDNKYHQAKAEIMKPIYELNEQMEERTLEALQAAITKARILRVVFVLFGLSLVVMLFRTNKSLRATLGGSTDEVYAYITRIGSGDFTSAIPVADQMKNSVLGWLAETQVNLNRIEQQRKQAETQLVESENHLRAMIENEPECIKIVDAQGRLRQMNPAGLAMIEADSLEQVAKLPVRDLIVPEYRAAFAAMHQRVLTGESVQMEFEILGLKGGRRWMETHAVPMQENGETVQLAVTRDITERKQAEEKLHLAASVFTHAREGIVITEPDGTIIDVNDTFTNITGYTREEALGQNPRILNSGRHDKEFFVAMWRSLTEKGHWYGEIWNRRKSGEVFAEMQTISAVRDVQGNIRHYVSLFSDITSLKEHEKHLEYIAHYDALTRLPNRVLLADRLRQGMVQAQRHGQPLAVAFLDLDGFKAINDNHGHEVGDQLLIVLASRMKQTMREGDTLSRLGGDEFVAVLLDLTHVAASVPMLTRLLAAAAQPVHVGDLVLQVSASLGVTFYPQAEDIDADQLMRQADQAMYQAKLAGKNCYHVFDAKQDSKLRGRYESLERIRRALAEHELVLHYQPKVNMRTGKVVGAEALIRWQHPERGLLSPAMFLPVIEGHALDVEIGEWVIDTALTAMENWRAAGLDIPVSVNVGARQLQQADFIERLREILAAHPKVEPSSLELEVLETSALEDVNRVSQIINACQDIGVKFSLDDFGTGYSSLTYLKRLPVALLKIDQSFVRDMLDDPEDLAILEGVLGLATAFHRTVIAEGVELAEHGTLLLQLGCELAQGYGIARPMPASEVPGWSASWRPDPVWLDLPAINRKDIPLLFASVELRAWAADVEAFLNGTRKAQPSLDHHQHGLGTWLDGEGLARYAVQPAFLAIKLGYQQIHALAAELYELQANDSTAEALARLNVLYGLRDTLLEQLQMLVKESWH